MAQAVVHGLEVVQIQEENGKTGVLALSSRQRVLDPVPKQGLVGQVGEGVVERLVGELVLEALVIGHVTEAPDPADDLALHTLRFRVPLERAPVLELDHVMALGLGLGVELADLGHERLGVSQLLEHEREGLVVVPCSRIDSGSCHISANLRLTLVMWPSLSTTRIPSAVESSVAPSKRERLAQLGLGPLAIGDVLRGPRHDRPGCRRPTR